MCQAQCPGSLTEQSGQGKGQGQQARGQSETSMLCDMWSKACLFVLNLCHKEEFKQMAQSNVCIIVPRMQLCSISVTIQTVALIN